MGWTCGKFKSVSFFVWQRKRKNNHNLSGVPTHYLHKERLLIELLRYKSKLPFDLYKEVLLNFRKIITQLNMQDIQDYAMAVPKRKMIMEALQMEVL